MKTLSSFALLVVVMAVNAQGPGMGQAQRDDMKVIHSLLGQNTKVIRKVVNLKDGVSTLTESKDPKVAKLIQQHAFAMQSRIKSGRPIRIWDPLFAELFQNYKKISMKVESTPQGVRVTETSTDPYTVTLIQWHAEGVNGFVKDGMAGMHKEHPAPPKPGASVKTKFLGLGDGLKTCPVTGEPISKSVTATIQGKTVYFCCPGCVEKVEKDPKLYLKWAK